MKIPKWTGHIGAASVMISSLTAALVLAICHHVFYQSLDDEKVDRTAFTQNVNTAGGTAFAFLVRAFLALAAATAYSQTLWRTLLRQQLSVRTIDSLSSLLTSVTGLLDFECIRRHPVLLSLALGSWALIPISTILPPATLSVHSKILIHDAMQPVRTFDWSAVAVADGFPICFQSPESLLASGCSVKGNQEAFALANNVAIQGRMSPVPMAINTSYIMELNAPSLNCQHVSPTVPDYLHAYCSGSIPVGCISWFPSATHTIFAANGSEESSNETSTSDAKCQNFLSSAKATQVTYWTGEDPHLFVATWTKPYAHNNATSSNSRTWELLRCGLDFSSYTIRIENQDQGQHVEVIDVRPYNYYTTALGRLGRSIWHSYDMPAWKINCLAIMSLMGQIVTGYITVDGDYRAQNVQESSLYNTPLYERGYFHWLRNAQNRPHSQAPPQALLAALLEELFQNITLSMLSSEHFTVPKNVNVTSWRSSLVYAYSWGHLAASYGGGMLVTIIVLAVGFTSLYENDASFSNTVSTFLRAADASDLHAIIAEGAYNGADPLPKALATTKLRFGPVAADGPAFGTAGATSMAHTGNAERVTRLRHTSVGSHADKHSDEDTASSMATTEDGDMA